MKYRVTVVMKTYEDYLVEAENEEEAIDKVISGEGHYEGVWPDEDPDIERVEVVG